jgi:hypothetical protein
MGMYTEFHYNVSLRKDVPADVVSILNYLTEGGDEFRTNDPFFECSRWRFLCTMDSYYFAADTCSSLRFDNIAQNWVLCIRSNLKNYSLEIEKFCEWLDPYVDAFGGDFLGFSRYEEMEIPTHIHKGGRCG